MKNNKISFFFALFFCLVAFEISSMEKQKGLNAENAGQVRAAKKAKQEQLLCDTQLEGCLATQNNLPTANPNSREILTKNDWTPLHYAALNGDTTAISALIQAGAEQCQTQTFTML